MAVVVLCAEVTVRLAESRSAYAKLSAEQTTRCAETVEALVASFGESGVPAALRDVVRFTVDNNVKVAEAQALYQEFVKLTARQQELLLQNILT